MHYFFKNFKTDISVWTLSKLYTKNLMSNQQLQVPVIKHFILTKSNLFSIVFDFYKN